MRSGAPNEITASTALNSLLQLPPGSTVQVSLTSEGNRYDKLKYAAEDMIREQISARSEREVSVRLFTLPSRFLRLCLYKHIVDHLISL
jgi:hypothetical protein